MGRCKAGGWIGEKGTTHKARAGRGVDEDCTERSMRELAEQFGEEEVGEGEWQRIWEGAGGRLGWWDEGGNKAGAAEGGRSLRRQSC